MKVVGFSFVRNAIKYDYPIIEAIRSILPLCDEVIVAVGNSDDDTLDLVKSIDPKVKIIETIWDDTLREGGRVLAIETDKAMSQIPSDCDWAIYIQGDEVIHEKYLPEIKKSMELYQNDPKVDGLLLKYKHFFGSYDYVGISSRWYRNEIRVIKPNRNIFSYRDAQGFRKSPNEKLNVKAVNAYVYHYGWVKHPDDQQSKHKSFNKLWHDEDWMEKHVYGADSFDYSNIDALEKFTDTHPKVMQDRIEKINWQFDFDISKNQLSFKEKFKNFFEKLTGYRLWEYKNYKKI